MTFFKLNIFPGAVTFINVPNRTIGGISSESGQSMVRILAGQSGVKIRMTRPNKPEQTE